MADAQTQGEPPGGSEARDATRRTYLASERTWLAWWRTGIAVAAVAIGVGRLLPGLAHGSKWPYLAIGIGYAALAIAILAIGAVRQRRVDSALDAGGYARLSPAVVSALSAAGIALAVVTLVLIATRF